MDLRAQSKIVKPSLASRWGFRSVLRCVTAIFAVTAYGCATTTVSPPETGVPNTQATTVITGPKNPVELQTASGYSMVPKSFSDLPAWQNTDFISARSAFLESCQSWSKRDGNKLISTSAPYSGTVSDWMPACTSIQAASDVSMIANVFETEFTPYFINPTDKQSKLTGYFEPELEVRNRPEAGFSKAVPGIPEDLVRVDPSEFDPKFAKGKVWGRVIEGELEFYPDRKDIIDEPSKALGYASPGEIFYLQIQGSGRLKFPDGRVIRAAFAAHNHKPFVSIARHLIDTGQIQTHQAGMNSILNWMDEVGPKIAQDAMNVNPRYVWFTPQEITDPSKGPNGAQGIPLTAMASMAVDPRYHAYGAPIFLDTKVPAIPGDWRGQEFRNLVIAQDTGGAIKGILRGDLFFGSGDEAGGRAASMNHDVAMWVLLPKSVASAMTEAQLLADSADG